MLSDLDRRLAEFASAQYGLIKRSQAHEIEMDDRRLQRRVTRGALERLSPNVFRIAGASSSWHQRLLAAAWAGGDDCCVSHRSAAALHPSTASVPASSKSSITSVATTAVATT